jgi:hypothetical protein
MKILLIKGIVVVAFAALSFMAPEHPAARVSADEDAIKKVIIAETEAFWDKDFSTLANQWAHGDYVRVVGWWQRGGVTVMKGWSVIGGRMEKLITDNPEKNRQHVRRESMNIRVSGNMAWVTFEQYGTDTGETAMDMPGLSYETRILEKQGGHWKIVYAGWLLDGGPESKQETK